MECLVCSADCCDPLFLWYICICSIDKKKGIKILFYSSVIDIHHIDVIFFAIIITSG